jgi:hypothetical protein
MWSVALTADRPAYAAGEPIAFTLTVTNAGGRPQALAFATAQRFDLVVRDRSGREVWRWSVGQMFAQVLGQETIPPGGVLTYTATLERGLPPGSYTATGRLTAREQVPDATLPLTVTPR